VKILIIAAGVGSRLQGLTEECPKALIKVQGKPILGQQLEVLTELGLNEFVFVVGHKGKQIKNYINENWSQLNVQFVENDNPLTKGTAYSVWLAKELIGDESYLHLHSDMLFGKEVIRDLINSPYHSAIVIDKKITISGRNQRVVLGGDKIIQMKNDQELENVAGKAVGIAKFSSENFLHLMQKARVEFDKGNLKQSYYSLIGKNISEKDFFVVDSKDHKLIEINTIEHLEMAESGCIRNE
jgi:L-glutamine-phosphate cytidylyltransferase